MRVSDNPEWSRYQARQLAIYRANASCYALGIVLAASSLVLMAWLLLAILWTRGG